MPRVTTMQEQLMFAKFLLLEHLTQIFRTIKLLSHIFKIKDSKNDTSFAAHFPLIFLQ